MLTIAAAAAPDPLELMARLHNIDRNAVRDWTSELLPGAAPVEADVPDPGRYILEIADSYNDASSADQ